MDRFRYALTEYAAFVDEWLTLAAAWNFSQSCTAMNTARLAGLGLRLAITRKRLGRNYPRHSARLARYATHSQSRNQKCNTDHRIHLVDLGRRTLKR